MAKISGFNEVYNGLSEGEAWQRIYEYGKNLMPIKERILQKKYNRIFNKKTKVLRDNVLTKINTERLVPGDIIVLEKGDFVPVDGKVLEEKALTFDNTFIPEAKEFLEDINDKVIYQGMRVKSGRAVIEAIRTGEATYLGYFVKKIDKKSVCESSFDRVIHRYFNIIGLIGLVLLLIGSIFSFTVNSGGLFIDRLIFSLCSGILLFFSVIPFGAIIALGLKMVQQMRIIYKSNLEIKDYSILLKAHKMSVICLDEKFLTRNYEKYIQRLYSAGIMIAVISKKSENEIKEIAKNAGIFDEDVETLSGSKIDNMDDDELLKAICNTVIFFEINQKQKVRIIEGFNRLGIKTIGTIEGIEDLAIREHLNLAVCTHNRKKNLDYEFSDARIDSTEITALYSLIKGSCITRNYLNHYIKYYIMFQLPVIISLLVAVLSKLNLSTIYFQTLFFTMLVIPILLLLINRDYSEELIAELKSREKKAVVDSVKFGFIGCFIGIITIGFYNFLSLFNISNAMKSSVTTGLLTVISILIILLSRKKCSPKKENIKINKDVIKEAESNDAESKENNFKESILEKEQVHKKEFYKKEKKKDVVKKEKTKKEKIKKIRKKESFEDIKDKLM